MKTVNLFALFLFDYSFKKIEMVFLFLFKRNGQIKNETIQKEKTNC